MSNELDMNNGIIETYKTMKYFSHQKCYLTVKIK